MTRLLVTVPVEESRGWLVRSEDDDGMSTLADQFQQLTPAEKRSVHLALGRHALLKWQGYSASERRLSYVESVSGSRQVVDTDLPSDAYRSSCEERDLNHVVERYGEPIIALQDGDLVFPESIEFAYYSLYNLFKKYALKEEIDDWLIVNQALATESEESRWRMLLEAAIQDIRGQSNS